MRIVFFIVAAALLAQSQTDAVLDLTQGRAATETGIRNLITHAPVRAQRLPVAVTILSLDRQSYALGDGVIYEVTIENTTGSTLTIPWSATRGAATNAAEGYIALVIQGDVARDRFVAGQMLFGSNVKKLAPGERVRIRAAGNWSIEDEDLLKRLRKRMPRPVRVWAEFNLYDPAVVPPYWKAISANSLTVELRKK